MWVWEGVIEFCKKNINANENYSKANCLLFGFQKPVLNIVMLVCKYQIHNARLFHRKITIESVIRIARGTQYGLPVQPSVKSILALVLYALGSTT